MRTEREEALRGVSHGGRIDEAIARSGAGREDWIDASSSVNPFPLPADLLAAAWAGAARRLGDYPDPAYRAGRAVLAERHGLDAARVWPTNGAAAAIHAVARLRPGAEALAPAPAFAEYAQAVRVLGGGVREPVWWGPARTDDAWDLDAIPAGGIVFVGHPSSPTGEILARDAIVEIAEAAAARGALCVVDEAFLPFVVDEPARTLVPFVDEVPSLVVVRSVTKTHALPGVRLGYVVAAPDLVDAVRAVSPPWDVNRFAAALAESLGPIEAAVEEGLRRTRLEAARFAAALAGRLRVRPSVAPFFLCEVPVDDLPARLERRRVLVRECGSYAGLGPRFVRVAVRTPEENDRVAAAIDEALAA